MNVSEAHVPLQTMLDIARQQPDYNHAFPILEVILTHFMGSPDATEAVRLVNEVKASFRPVLPDADGSPASARNLPATVNNLLKASVGGRPRMAGTLITKTFRYEGETARLGILCQALKALGWIAEETDAQAFIDQFSGGETVRQRVIWMGGVNTIAELFRRLVNERRLVALPAGHSIWVMVNARFWEKERRQEFGTDRLRNTHSPKGNDQPIAYLVGILDPEMSLDEVRQMLESQR